MPFILLVFPVPFTSFQIAKKYFLFPVPNGPPLNVTTSVTRTTVILSWQPPSLIYRNTFNSISWYIVKVKQSSIRAFPSEGTNVTTTIYTVVNLSPGIVYDFLILAGNEFGISQDLNGAEATDTTSEDGMCMSTCV